ncbi:MAG: FHA domain-containing protein, partial [Acidimicrobiaceae bacterium]|nr:FHA domain-containing protein [Acidimicrobiaceae bacterium]
PQDANFCSSCGAVLERPTQSDPSATTVTLPPVEIGDEEAGVQVETGMLVVRRGPNAGSRFSLDRDLTTVGRHPESDIFLDDVTVSRRHAELIRGEGTYRVRDVGSLNGTYLNRERIEEADMRNGDLLQIGKFQLVFLAEVWSS